MTSQQRASARSELLRERSGTSPSHAADLADEQIAYWHAIGDTPDDAWRGLGLPWAWAVEWREVRAMLIRYLLGALVGDERARLAA